MKPARLLIPQLLALLVSTFTLQAGESLSLAGSWRFALDRLDVGVKEQWFQQELPERLRLPGSLQEQGFGDLPTVDTQWMGDLNDRTFFTEARYAPYREPANFKFPYWLTPTRYYAGAAWYQRDLDIPAAWAGRRMVLHLERPHWETTLWVDDRLIGSQNSLAVPHEYDLAPGLAPGRHRLTIRVDNRYVVPVGVNSHSVSDHTQGNWNGLAGELTLVASDPVWLSDIQVHPDVAARTARVKVQIGNATGQPGRGTLAVGPQTAEVGWSAQGGSAELTVKLDPKAGLWDEFQPNLQTLEIELATERGSRPPGQEFRSRRSVRFGLREVGVTGTQITLNGRPLFLRGTLECAIFPRTGYPPTDVPSWKRIMRIARAHGLNHLRFHSWTPPRAAFVAADELGFYLYVECPTWANGDTSVGDGRPVDRWITEEGDRILRAFGNHPSFIMMSYGNEPGGRNQNRWLGDLVKHWQAQDPRRLYTSGAGWPMIPENDFHVTPGARAFPVHAKLGETANDYSGWLAKQNKPIVSHEIGQYCVFPNLDEIPRYHGWLQARNFEIVRDFLRQRDLLGQARDFLQASGRFQALFYKDEIEACLRTPGWAGFELLDLHDFPGQGTALVGVLDPFWNEKGYITPRQYRRFCDETVPLARLPKRIWTAGETFRATVDVAHFGRGPLRATPTWQIREPKGKRLARGAFGPVELATGQVSGVGVVEIPLTGFAGPRAFNLEVTIPGTRFVNDWNFWVYPADRAEAPPGVTVVSRFDDAAVHTLMDGGRVVVLAEPQRIQGRTVGRFDPIFWNKMWFPTQPQHTLGLLVDPRHPALAGFPTTFHSDWQWQDVHNRSKPMILDALPKELQPVVQVIDDWNTCRKLGLAIEASVGRGRLLICSADLTTDLEHRPAARQLRRSLLDYAAGRRFDPRVALTVDQVQALFREPTDLESLGAKVVRASSAQPEYGAEHLLDGEPGTIWHTTWGDRAAAFPHEVVIGFERSVALRGVVLLPRQDGNKNGWIKDYAIQVSEDGEAWGAPVAEGTFGPNAEEKEVTFAKPVQGRFVKLVAKSAFDTQPFASLAEFGVRLTSPPR